MTAIPVDGIEMRLKITKVLRDMKNRIFTFSVLASLAVLVSCQKEDGKNPSFDMFTASIVNGFNTKTTITNDRKVYWEADDEVSINGVKYKATPKADATKATLAKYDSKSAPTGTFYAYFPYSIYDGTTATLPSNQTYAAGKLNAPMYGESATNTISFKNICAVLAITVKSSEMATVKKIRVSSSNCAMSGAFTVSSDKAVLTSPGTIANNVILDCGTGAAPASEGTVFYVAIPAQTYRNLLIELSSDGSTYPKSMITKKDVDIAVSVNNIYPISFGNMVFDADGTQVYADGSTSSWF